MKAQQRAALSRGGDIGERMFSFTHEMFEHANEYRNVFLAMVGTQSGVVVQRLLQKLLIDLVHEDVKAASERGTTSAVTIDAVTQFIAGGLLGLLTWWLKARPRPSAAEVNRLFRTCAMPALTAVSK